VSHPSAAIPMASFVFVTALIAAAAAVQIGLVPDDTIRLWAHAATAGNGEVPIGRIVAAYPNLPFLTTTLVALIVPDGTPAPALVAASVLALIAGFCYRAFRGAGLPVLVAGAATLLIAFHPMLLRAAIAGPADMFLAAFLFMLAGALYDLRARTSAPEVMAVGLALLALTFSHPMGAAAAFAAVPLLVFVLRPTLVAHSAWNVVVALVFPTLFGIGCFAYVSWVFPGAGWSFIAAPTESLSSWSAGIARVLDDRLTGFLAIDATFVIGAALALSAPLAVVASAWVYRRRPLVAPAMVFAATMIAAAAITVTTGLFGDPTAISVAAPALAAIVIIRIPLARERLATVIALLVMGWIGGAASLALLDQANVARALAGRDPARLDALAAGGASIGRDGVLVDTDNAPPFLLCSGRARGVFDPSNEQFALAMLFSRLETPFVAVPDPRSVTGANDRLNRAFPSLFRQGAPGYRLVYQNDTWRLFASIRASDVYKD
jgi:hypothetical protein